jgi:predicted transcriptional regulator
MSTRMLDFYFFSRVASDIGDKTVFSYNVDVMMEERFIIFLKAYHKIFPLSELEIRFLKESYRFFILNYVIKYGRFFFHEIFATKLQKEALEIHLPTLDEKFDAEPLLNALDL